MTGQKIDRRYSDENLANLKEYFNLKFDQLNKNINDIQYEIKKHDILLVGQDGDGGIVKENNNLKNSVIIVKWIGIFISSMVAFLISIKSFFK